MSARNVKVSRRHAALRQAGPGTLCKRFPRGSLNSWHAVFVKEDITIRISGEAVLWVGRKAMEENKLISRMVVQILGRQMIESGSCGKAYELFRTYRPSDKVSAAGRLRREDIHERR